MAETVRPSNMKMVLRALARRCPHCGARGIFATYTELRETCPSCGLRLHRGEADYFIGAYLLNLVAVELLFAAVLAIWALATWPNTPWKLIQWTSLVLIVLGAFVAYPFAKSLWLAADLIFRPLSAQELAWHREGGAPDRELPHL